MNKLKYCEWCEKELEEGKGIKHRYGGQCCDEDCNFEAIRRFQLCIIKRTRRDIGTFGTNAEKCRF